MAEGGGGDAWAATEEYRGALSAYRGRCAAGPASDAAGAAAAAPPAGEPPAPVGLAVVQFLRQGGTLEDLKGPPYAIRAKRGKELPGLVCLHYDQIESKPGDRFVRECRGLILDEADSWRPVCCPYFRFDNYNSQMHAVTEEDWRRAKVFAKLDGTLINVYFYAGKWMAGTSNFADGKAPIFGVDGGFYGDFFWQVWAELGYSMPTDTGLCYMFELQSPETRVICPVEQRSITLHGARRLATLEEVDPVPLAAAHGWAMVQEVHFPSMAAVVAAAERLPVHEEGYVVVLPGFVRYKVKGRAYVLAAHLPKSEGKLAQADCRKDLLSVALRGEAAEFTAAFPHLRQVLDALAAEVVRATAGVEALAREMLSEAGPADQGLLGRAARKMQERKVARPMQNAVIHVLKGERSAAEVLAAAGPDAGSSLLRVVAADADRPAPVPAA